MPRIGSCSRSPLNGVSLHDFFSLWRGIPDELIHFPIPILSAMVWSRLIVLPAVVKLSADMSD
jgi:hypothetical protein